MAWYRVTSDGGSAPAAGTPPGIIAGADGGFLTEAARVLTGLRRDPGEEVRRAFGRS